MERVSHYHGRGEILKKKRPFVGLRGAGRLGASGNFPQDEERAWREAGGRLVICQGGLRRPRGGHSVRAKLISVQGKSAAPQGRRYVSVSHMSSSTFYLGFVIPLSARTGGNKQANKQTKKPGMARTSSSGLWRFTQIFLH